jgi:uncharacterized RDD family membrane protein YckC
MEKIPCTSCGKLILPETAEKTGGDCIPCQTWNTRGKYNTAGERIFAAFIDGLILLCADKFFKYLAGLYNNPYISVSTIILTIVLFRCYSVLMHGFYGQTIGKILTRVIVLDISENKLSMKQAIMRDIVPIVVASIAIITILNIYFFKVFYTSAEQLNFFKLLYYTELIWIVAELLTMLTNKKRRAVHDFIARSVVVDKLAISTQPAERS